MTASALSSGRSSRRQRLTRVTALLGGAALTLAATLSWADEFPGIRKLMGEEQFNAAGLDRLDPEQLKSLDAWLLRYTAGEAELLQIENKEVKKARESFSLKARIQGDFKGWDGDTSFYLDNGQVWRQRLSGRYKHRGSPNPEVEISVNWLGYYKMTVLESGKSVGVSLVR